MAVTIKFARAIQEKKNTARNLKHKIAKINLQQQKILLVKNRLIVLKSRGFNKLSASINSLDSVSIYFEDLKRQNIILLNITEKDLELMNELKNYLDD